MAAAAATVTGVDDYDLLRRSVREYVEREAPLEQISRWDEAGEYPQEFFEGLAALGYFAAPFPERLGGSGLGATGMAIIGEELGRHGLDLGAGYGLTILSALNLVRHATPAQLAERIPRVLTLQERYAVGITEPEAGSDASATRTRAHREGSTYIVSGQKVFCSGAGLPRTVIHALVRTTHNSQRHNGLSVLLIPAGAPGVETVRMATVGRHLLGTWEVFLHDVRVPVTDRVGNEGAGWAVITSGLEIERVYAGAQLVGAATTVVRLATTYVNERVQFGRSLGEFQVIAHRLADIHTKVEAARLLVYRAAELIDAGAPADVDAASAKLRASETLQEAARWGMQFMGGYGYTKEYPMERFWREAQSATVAAGTSEIQRSIIAKHLGIGTRRRVSQ